MTYAILALLVVLIVLVVVLLSRSGAKDSAVELLRIESAIAGLRQEFGDSLQKNSIVLSSQVTKSGADMRQDMTDRIAGGFKDIGARVEAQLLSNREEGARSMTAANEAVIKRLGEFGDRTEQRLAALEKKTGDSLELIRAKVDARLSEIGQQVQAKLDENIKEGFSHFEKVQEHLRKAETQLIGLSAVGTSINDLNNLLKLPHLRGGFGEASLELIISDVLPANLYERQAQITPGSTERVDILVNLPGASLPIDSKFPREQVLPLFEACDAVKLAEARLALSRLVKEQAKDISSKYIKPEHGTTDMALMFLPSETLYFEIVRDGELWSFLQARKVYPVSPNTLAVTLKGISIAHNFYLMAKGVETTIEDIRKAKKHFVHFEDKFEDVGKSIEKANEAYNKSKRHLSHYQSSVVRLTGDSPAELPDLPAEELPEPSNQ
ncbi:MAG TPA: DNA recombination protein RmuC [Nitrospirota bacterium]